jgi:hypothetical protein
MSKAAELANLIGNINMGGGGVGRNLLINGAMNVAQRSTSVTGLGATAGYFGLDRWKTDFSSTAGRLTLTQDSSVPTGEGFFNSLKVACTTADTSIAAGEQFTIEQSIEAQNLQTVSKGTSGAKPLTLSFYCKANANATYVVELYAQDVDRRISSLFSVTTDWTRVTVTFPADTTGEIADDNGIGIKVSWWLHAGSNYSGGTLQTTWAAAANNTRATGGDSFFDSTSRTFFLTGCQLEVGQNATTFEHEPFERTLTKCHRYFHRVGDAADSNGYSVLIGGYQPTAGDDYTSYVQHPVEMRATPTSTISGTWEKVNSSDIKTAYVTTKGFTFFGTIGGAGAWYLHSNSTDDHVTFDAEL